MMCRPGAQLKTRCRSRALFSELRRSLQPTYAVACNRMQARIVQIDWCCCCSADVTAALLQSCLTIGPPSQLTGMFTVVGQVHVCQACKHGSIYPPGSTINPSPPSKFQPATSAPDEIKAFLLPAGSVLCVDQSFMDYAGWGPQELVGKPFSSLSVDPGELER